MKILSCIAALSALSLFGCGTLAAPVPCARLSISPVQRRALDVSFRRDATSQIIMLHLAWAAPGAPFYTPYGPLQSLALTEGATTVEVPPDRISHIEDIRPESITLRSARTGSYELSIPQGVPAAVPEIITIRSGRLVSIRTAESFYLPPPSHP